MNANIIAALNGPMAHIYVKGNTGWGKDSIPDDSNVENIAEMFRLFMQKNNAAEAESEFGLPLEDYHAVRATMPKLKESIDKILIRVNGAYKIFNGINEAPEELTETLGEPTAHYLKAITRIEKMNHPERSGDIVLIMKARTADSELNRYTSGVACKSWHGGLNPSDSYVPLIVAYPGGNKKEIEPLISGACPTGCEGNWKATDLIKTIISKQYGAQ